MSTLPDDTFWGLVMMAAVFGPWLLAPVARWSAGHIVARAQINAVHRRQAKACRDARASTTYWLGDQPLSAEEFTDLAGRDGEVQR